MNLFFFNNQSSLVSKALSQFLANPNEDNLNAYMHTVEPYVCDKIRSDSVFMSKKSKATDDLEHAINRVIENLRIDLSNVKGNSVIDTLLEIQEGHVKNQIAAGTEIYHIKEKGKVSDYTEEELENTAEECRILGHFSKGLGILVQNKLANDKQDDEYDLGGMTCNLL